MVRYALVLTGCVLISAQGLVAQRPGTAAPPSRPPPAAAGSRTAADQARIRNLALEARARRSHTDRRTGAPLGGAAVPPAALGPRPLTPEQRRERTTDLLARLEEDFVRVLDQRVTYDLWFLDEAKGTRGQYELDVTMKLEGGRLRHRVVVSHREGASVKVDDDLVVNESRGKRATVWRRDASASVFVPESRGLSTPLSSLGLRLEDALTFDPLRATLRVEGEVWRDGEVALEVTAKGGLASRTRRMRFDPSTRLPTYWTVEEGGKVASTVVASQPRTRDGVRAFERIKLQRADELLIFEVRRREVNRGLDSAVFTPEGVTVP